MFFCLIMNKKEIPIAVRTIIPIINPISKSESDVSFDIVSRSLFEISIVELSGSVSLVELSIACLLYTSPSPRD